MFWYSRSKLLSSGKTTFLSKTVPNTFCRPILPRKRGRDENKLHIFHQNHKLTPLEKWNVCASLNVFLVDRLVFVSRTSPKRLFCLYIGYRMKKIIIFDPEQWTNQPLWKNANLRISSMNFILKLCHFPESIFLSLKRLVFNLDSHQTFLVGLFCIKRQDEQILNFSPKPWPTPLKNANFPTCYKSK